jgi:uncharacterized lipoprotein YddW (UPF0748 family)
MKLAIWGLLWMDAEQEGAPERIIARCKQSGIGTYLTYVNPMERCSLGMWPAVTYRATVFQAETRDLMTPLLKAASKEKVAVEPWLLPFESAPLVGETPDGMAARSYQPAALLGLGPLGKKVQPAAANRARKRLCPTWAENRQRGIVILKDMIEHHGAQLAGIHMDGIRYGDVDMCWEDPCHCEACRTEYRNAFGKDIITAEELKLPGFRYKFVAFRTRCIRSLVEEIRDITRKAGLRLTMAARAQFFDYGLPEGQDWPQWARDGLVDIVFAMNYSTDRSEHRGRVELHVSLMKNKGKVLHYDGVGKKSSIGENSTENMATFARDALSAGADGICIYHYAALKDEDFAAVKALNS